MMQEVSAPEAVVQQLFEASQRGDAKFDPAAHFGSALDGRWAEIPQLNDAARAEQFAPGSLVRFRCMIQNVYNPEFYVAEYDMTNPQTGERVRACGRFADTIKTMPGFTADLSGPTATTEERLPLHCVSIPGESAWVRELLRGPAPPAAAAAASSSTVGATNKRPLEDEDEEMQGDVMEEDAPAGQKKPKQEGAAAKQAPVKGGTLKEGEHAAIVKVYEPAAQEALKVNEIVEFVGILTCDPILAEFPESGEDAEDAFARAGPPPSSVAPRIHAFCYRKLSPFCPATDSIPVALRTQRVGFAGARAAQARDAVVRRLAGALGNDMGAAQWALLASISKIHQRTTGLLVGKLSVGISGFPAGSSGSSLGEALGGVLPAVEYLPLSTKGLNKCLYAPKKDYETEQLSYSCLQLPSGTRLVLDETTMKPGQLNDTGCKNLMAIQSLVTRQIVPFDFSFYQVDFPTDVPVIVTSQAKPLVPVDCLYRIEGVHQPVEHAELSADEEEACRLYMTAARALEVEIGEDVCNLAEQHFVQARQADARIGQEDLHRWLTVVRLLSASYLEATVTPQRWSEMVELEARRIASLPPQPAASASPAAGGAPMQAIPEVETASS